jgi:hypothetical protein
MQEVSNQELRGMMQLVCDITAVWSYSPWNYFSFYLSSKIWPVEE